MALTTAVTRWIRGASAAAVFGLGATIAGGAATADGYHQPVVYDEMAIASCRDAGVGGLDDALVEAFHGLGRTLTLRSKVRPVMLDRPIRADLLRPVDVREADVRAAAGHAMPYIDEKLAIAIILSAHVYYGPEGHQALYRIRMDLTDFSIWDAIVCRGAHGNYHVLDLRQLR